MSFTDRLYALASNVPGRFFYAGVGVLALVGAQDAGARGAQNAAAIELSRSPAVVGKLPAPNVIVSVDDSGSMGAEGIETLKQALRSTFTQSNVPDGSIRLGWQSMNRCSQIPSSGDCRGINAVRVLDAQRRADFGAWINTLTSEGSTPSHHMLYNAGEYLSGPTGVNSPWAKEPGVRELPYLACRRSYNVFLSDGGWNIASAENPAEPGASSYYWLNRVGAAWARQVGNFDGTSKDLPEPLNFGTGSSRRFDANSAQTRIYRDQYGDLQTNGRGSFASFPTLSDLAFYYWARDLQPGIPNEVHPSFPVDREERISKGSKSLTLDKNWNPKNNPATWQHMTLYTVGFLNAAYLREPLQFGDTTWSGGDYENLVLGNKTWADPILRRGAESVDFPARYPELWHAAINTRGKFIPAPTASTLAPAFKDILSSILAGNQRPLTSMALTANTTRTDSRQYVSGYSPLGWTGHVTAHTVAAGNAAVNAQALWNAAEVMDAAAQGAPGRFWQQRRMFTARESGRGGVVGVTWSPQAASLDSWLDAAQIAQLGAGDESRARAVAAYIQGDRSRESGGSGTFRNRASLLGDIVNSRIWVMHGNHFQTKTKAASRPDVVFVGANDGALHAFDAASGQEVMAYVPRGVFPRLASLAEPGYQHHYFVDGSPLTRDVNYDPADPASFAGAQTYLAGFLGAGGKGYFVLNVTNKGEQAFDRITPAELVKADYTFAAAGEAPAGATVQDPHIGHILGTPTTDQVNRFDAVQLAYLNAPVGTASGAGAAGKWALITGNGYNSEAGMPVLYVQPLAGGAPLKIHALGGSPTAGQLALYGGKGNGLSSVRPVDMDGNGTVDYVYAGDLLGNVWKFDLREANTTQWQNPLNGRPLLHAPQLGAITAAPSYVVHPEGGLQLLFGSGRLLSDEDRDTLARGFIVSLRDDFSNTPLDFAALTNIEANATSNASGALGPDTAGAAQGSSWYFQLPYEGTRVLDNNAWLTGNTFYVPFQRPASGTASGDEESCELNYRPARNYFALVDIWRGNAFKPASPSAEQPQNLFLIGEDVLANSFLYGEGGAKGVAPPGLPTVDFVFGQGQGVTPTWRVVE